MSTTGSMRAIRGAITVERDERTAIVNATEQLLLAMLERNGVAPEAVISMIFTATPDLTSEFPAAAAGAAGLGGVPRLCAT
jgi:chorismate mutase